MYKDNISYFKTLINKYIGDINFLSGNRANNAEIIVDRYKKIEMLKGYINKLETIKGE